MTVTLALRRAADEQVARPVRRKKTRCGALGLVHLKPGGGSSVRGLRCKSWGHASCASVLGARWGHTLNRAAGFAQDEGPMPQIWKPRLFVTVTIDPKVIEEACRCAACTERLAVGWLRGSTAAQRPKDCLLIDYRYMQEWLVRKMTALWRRIRRVHGPCEYFRVFEYHAGSWDPLRQVENNRLHVHAIVSTDMKPSLFDDYAANLGLGRTHCAELESMENAGAYARKYATKQKPECYAWRVRVAGSSRAIRHQQFPKAEGEWFTATQYVPGKRDVHSSELMRTVEDAGGEVQLDKGGRVVVVAHAGTAADGMLRQLWRVAHDPGRNPEARARNAHNVARNERWARWRRRGWQLDPPPDCTGDARARLVARRVARLPVELRPTWAALGPPCHRWSAYSETRAGPDR